MTILKTRAKVSNRTAAPFATTEVVQVVPIICSRLANAVCMNRGIKGTKVKTLVSDRSCRARYRWAVHRSAVAFDLIIVTY